MVIFSVCAVLNVVSSPDASSHRMAGALMTVVSPMMLFMDQELEPDIIVNVGERQYVLRDRTIELTDSRVDRKLSMQVPEKLGEKFFALAFNDDQSRAYLLGERGRTPYLIVAKVEAKTGSIDFNQVTQNLAPSLPIKIIPHRSRKFVYVLSANRQYSVYPLDEQGFPQKMRYPTSPFGFSTDLKTEDMALNFDGSLAMIIEGRAGSSLVTLMKVHPDTGELTKLAQKSVDDGNLKASFYRDRIEIEGRTKSFVFDYELQTIRLQAERR